jgi:hypothetical protein
MIDPKFRKALECVVEYLWHDERHHYMEALINQGGRNHVFRSVALLEPYLTESQPVKAAAKQKEISAGGSAKRPDLNRTLQAPAVRWPAQTTRTTKQCALFHNVVVSFDSLASATRS